MIRKTCILAMTFIMLMAILTGCASSKKDAPELSSKSEVATSVQPKEDKNIKGKDESASKAGEKAEEEKMSEKKSAAADDDYSMTFVLPFSSRRLIEEKEIKELNTKQLELARNEIYARHGYIFKTEYFKRYFEDKPWYKANVNFNENDFTAIEKDNIKIIKEFEEKVKAFVNVVKAKTAEG